MLVDGPCEQLDSRVFEQLFTDGTDRCLNLFKNITNDEVDFIKAEYGVDVMDSAHVKMIMDDQFLLGFVVVDQAEELVYVVYDGHDYGFQTYTFPMLEREAKDSQRELISLYRAMSR